MKFEMKEQILEGDKVSAKLGTDTVANAGDLTDADVGKPVKLVATDRYGICAEGDEIEGFLTSVESFTADGYAFGTVQIGGRKKITCDGTIAMLNTLNVLAGTVVAAKTALTGPAQVKTGVIASQGAADPFAYTERTPNTHLWRLVSGSGTDTTLGVIERM